MRIYLFCHILKGLVIIFPKFPLDSYPINIQITMAIFWLSIFSINVTELKGEQDHQRLCLFSDNCLEKIQYFGLEIFLRPLMFPNKKISTLRVKLFINLVLLLVKGDLMVYWSFESSANQHRHIILWNGCSHLVLRPILTVNSVWNTGETGDINQSCA